LEVGTIADIQSRDDLILITDLHEVEKILSDIGFPTDAFGGLFVATRDGHYTEVFGYPGSVPYVFKPLYQIITPQIP
jgi:hypothetical protein